jgi:hypothetical protein
LSKLLGQDKKFLWNILNKIVKRLDLQIFRFMNSRKTALLVIGWTLLTINSLRYFGSRNEIPWMEEKSSFSARLGSFLGFHIFGITGLFLIYRYYSSERKD